MKKGKIVMVMIIIVAAIGLSDFLSMSQEDSSIQQPNLTNRTAELPTRHIIEVPYIPMYEYWAICGMASLEMQLEYFGADYPVSLLTNIDWGYGTIYMNTPAGKWLFPYDATPEGISYTAKMLGCNVTAIDIEDEEEAWKTLKGFLAQDMPVITPWSSHVVLAVGYDESGPVPRVIFHNPSYPDFFLNPPPSLGIKPEGFNSTLGAYASLPLSTWMSRFFWGASPKKHEMIIAKPEPGMRTEMPWGEIMARNAQKTLGLGEWAPRPGVWYGCKADRQMARDIETGKLTPEDLTKIFTQLFPTKNAPASRSHASAFLAAFAESSGSIDLRKASKYFELAGYKWQEVDILWKYVQDHPDEVSEEVYMSRLAKVFRQIAEYEEMAGNALMKGAKNDGCSRS